MFDVGGGELLLIILAIIVLFGPKKLPEIAQMFGKGMRQVKKAQAQIQSQISELQTDIKSVIETPKEAVAKNFNAIKTEFDKSLDQQIPTSIEMTSDNSETIENKLTQQPIKKKKSQ